MKTTNNTLNKAYGGLLKIGEAVTDVKGMMFLAKVYVQFENALKPVNLALKKLQRDYSKFAEDGFIKGEKLIEMKEKEDEIRDTEIEFKIEKVTISAQDQSQVEEKIFTTKDISKVVELYGDKFELSLK